MNDSTTSFVASNIGLILFTIGVIFSSTICCIPPPGPPPLPDFGCNLSATLSAKLAIKVAAGPHVRERSRNPLADATKPLVSVDLTLPKVPMSALPILAMEAALIVLPSRVAEIVFARSVTALKLCRKASTNASVSANIDFAQPYSCFTSSRAFSTRATTAAHSGVAGFSNATRITARTTLSTLSTSTPDEASPVAIFPKTRTSSVADAKVRYTAPRRSTAIVLALVIMVRASSANEVINSFVVVVIDNFVGSTARSIRRRRSGSATTRAPSPDNAFRTSANWPRNPSRAVLIAVFTASTGSTPESASSRLDPFVATRNWFTNPFAGPPPLASLSATALAKSANDAGSASTGIHVLTSSFVTALKTSANSNGYWTIARPTHCSPADDRSPHLSGCSDDGGGAATSGVAIAPAAGSPWAPISTNKRVAVLGMLNSPANCRFPMRDGFGSAPSTMSDAPSK